MANRPSSEVISSDRVDGGLVTVIPPHALGVNQSPDAQNFDPSSRDGAKKRKGFIKFTDPAKAVPTGTFVSGLFGATLSTGTSFILATEGTALHDITGVRGVLRLLERLSR